MACAGARFELQLLPPVQPHRILNQQLLPLLHGTCDSGNVVDQFTIIRHVRFHVGVRPIGAPQDAVFELIDDVLIIRNNIVVWCARMAAKRLVEARQQYGKGRASADRTKRRSLSVESLIRTYQHDVEKKQVLLRKATATRNELMFITEALRKLLDDENFVTLLRAEALATIPKNLSDRLAARTGGI
mgnify:CR=1 FL=1